MEIPSYHLLIFVVLTIAVVSQWKVLADDCTKINACSCKNSQGTIDLSPLDSGGGDPKFKDVPSTDAGGNSFSWNPCTPFSEGDGSCTNVAACQIQNGFPFNNYINIGRQDSAAFVSRSGNLLSLQYSATMGGVKRTTYVNLICDPARSPGTFEAMGEDPRILANYLMVYTGVYACPVANAGNGLSAGSILLIIFFVLLFLYLICGVVYQKFFRKASGKELLPHLPFWTSLPGLIQEYIFLYPVANLTKDTKMYDDVACQLTTMQHYFPTGTQDSAEFQTGATGMLTLVYSATLDGTTRTTHVTLTCDPSNDPGQFTALGEDPTQPTYYDLEYSGIYACPRATHGGTGGLSPGSIICIVFFTLLFVYVVGGVAFQIFVRKESGVKAIPQSSFWLALPMLIKAKRVEGISRIGIVEVSPDHNSIVNLPEITMCEIKTGETKEYINIGTQDSARYQFVRAGLTVLIYDEPDLLTTTHVTLLCNSSGDPGSFIISEDFRKPGQFYGEYNGKYACEVQATPSPPGEILVSGFSIGTLVCFAFTGSVALFFLIGVPYKVFVNQAHGFAVIPLLSTWINIVSLVRDGVRSILCKKPRGPYEEMEPEAK